MRSKSVTSEKVPNKPRRKKKFNLDDYQYEVGKWGDEIFPQADLKTMSHKLLEECYEIIDNPSIDELADAWQVILHMAHRLDKSLMQASRRKMGVNRKRIWGEPGDNNVVRHIEKSVGE